MIAPVSSAIGMKSTGDTGPKVRLSHRRSASTPASAPSSVRWMGWYARESSPSATAVFSCWAWWKVFAVSRRSESL